MSADESVGPRIMADSGRDCKRATVCENSRDQGREKSDCILPNNVRSSVDTFTARVRMIFQVDGTDKRTGESKSLTIEAMAGADAKLMASRLGIVVTSVTVVGGVPQPVVEVEQADDSVTSTGHQASVARPAAFTRPGMVAPFRQRTFAQDSGRWIVYGVFVLLAVVLVVSGLRDLSYAPLYVPEFDGDSSAPSLSAISLVHIQTKSHHLIGIIKIACAILVALLIEAIRLRNLMGDRLGK